jgi:NADP-dependent 3-hydroxy acid dehydrogenase YdfG
MVDRIGGRSVIVTGAGNGFGKLTAEKLAARGARVACLDVNREAATAVADAITAVGGKVIAIEADVSSLVAMRQAAATALAAFGSIDVLVNNAGVMPLSFLDEHETAVPAWMRCIDINLKGMIHGCAAVHDQMMAQGRGHIVNLSSIYGNRPTAGAAVYGATKAAVDYFSHALRQEARGRIKVTVVKPTGVLATGLADSVINKAAGAPIVGHNLAEFYAAYASLTAGEAGDLTDPEEMENAFLGPEPVADAIVHVIDQPWGVSISDITVRASGDHYIN